MRGRVDCIVLPKAHTLLTFREWCPTRDGEVGDIWCEFVVNNVFSVSHGQAMMKDFLDLLIHSGGIKPSTQCDRHSVALVSNVRC